MFFTHTVCEQWPYEAVDVWLAAICYKILCGTCIGFGLHRKQQQSTKYGHINHISLYSVKMKINAINAMKWERSQNRGTQIDKTWKCHIFWEKPQPIIHHSFFCCVFDCFRPQTVAFANTEIENVIHVNENSKFGTFGTVFYKTRFSLYFNHSCLCDKAKMNAGAIVDEIILYLFEITK